MDIQPVGKENESVLYDQEKLSIAQEGSSDKAPFQPISDKNLSTDKVSEIFTPSVNTVVGNNISTYAPIDTLPKPGEINTIAGDELDFIQKVEETKQAKEDQTLIKPAHGSQ